MRKLIVIAGIPLDDLNMEQALDRLGEFIASGRPHQVATVNADFIVHAWDDPELRHILQNADLLTADGMPLVWGARLLGVPLEGRVTGADMVPALAGRAAQKGWRLYFLGARPGVAARAAEILTARHPTLQVAGIHSPPQSTLFEMEPDLIERIRQARPDVLLVAFGNPKQEKWIYMHLHDLGVPVCIGVGGTFDFIAGEVRRAPPWMQRSGLEWLYRLLQEPRRMWRRYVVDIFQFARFFLAQWLRQVSGHKFEVLPLPEKENNPASLCFSGALTVANRAAFQEKVEAALAQAPAPPTLTLDMSGVTFMDSASLGALVALTKQARAAGGDLVVRGVRPEVRRSIELLRLDRFLNLGAPCGPAALAGVMALHVSSGWSVYQMPPRLDVANAQGVCTGLATELAASPQLIADLHLTEFIDSSGIAALLALHRQLANAGGELRLAGLRREPRRTLELAGMQRVFHLYEEVETAIYTPLSSPFPPRSAS